CDKCWADNDPECCWYPTGAQPCHCCDALKRACTISGRKTHEHRKVDPHVQRNFKKAVLVRRARVFVLEQRKLLAVRKAISIGISSLALLTTQESRYVVDVVDLAPPTPKGKGKAPSMPRKQRASTSGDEQPAKRLRSGTASRKGAKTVPHWEETPPVAGPSRQIIPVDPVESVLCPGGVVLSEPELPSVVAVQSEPEEAAESSNSSESSSEVPAVPLCAVSQVFSLTVLCLTTVGRSNPTTRRCRFLKLTVKSSSGSGRCWIILFPRYALPSTSRRPKRRRPG
ncbi:hypothetical protein C0992_011879, partial [Termitomyces sp. T32_za158]